MKDKKSNDDDPIFIPYDDENMTHALCGPDYGQVDTGSKSTSWSEIDSKEYNDFVDYITDRIITGKKFSLFKKSL